ncbi:hypothetical protein VVT58_19075 (plasmid) [Sphingobium sp. SJ10-10]|uniref:hypothetical protein n=1 Tax=Sphingobium sp. SJ10-10 TaxID=3114999 RepID=UPI002E191B0E|nr:hypothetical protein [Sphingobium sp. SJ10-10]
MKGPQILGCLVIAVMGALMINILIHDGMDHGVGFDVFLAGAGDPWQLFINNDLVTGLWFMCGWIILRERGGRVIDRVAWVWMVLWWGNIIVAAYVLRAAWQSGGDWQRFFLGRQAGTVRETGMPPIVRVGSGLAGVAVILWLAQALVLVRWAGIPTAGYLLGFLPIILTLLLLAFPARPMARR